MPQKIKILFYSHSIDYAGTWRSHERILLNLDLEKFDPYVFYNPRQDNNRLDYLKTKMDNNKIISFETSQYKKNPEEGWRWEVTNFSSLAKEYNFDIIHFTRSGHFEWPFIERISPIQIETNIFGSLDNSEFLDYSVTVSNYLTNLRGKSDKMIYNPIPEKIDDESNLFEELGLPKNIPIFGRIGRPANFNSISLDALKIYKNMGYDFRYIIIGACQDSIQQIKMNGLENECIIIEQTNDDFLIHKFNNTIDLFLHYRNDGETFGTAIAQSMMYGKPVISHYGYYNGHVEIIDNSGFVCSNVNDYLTKILELTQNKDEYDKFSKLSKERAMEFEEKKIVKEWENFYIEKYELQKKYN